MTFTNEYVSQEDREKFDLYGLHKKYQPYSKFRKDELTYDWVIDRERKIWFKFVTMMDDPEYEHQYTKEHVFVLQINDTKIEVRLWNVKREGHAIDGPMLVVWDLLSISPKSLEDVSEDEIKNIVKEALDVFGYGGQGLEVPNTTVQCNF